MWIAIILTIISTFAGLLSLWTDDFLSEKEIIHDDESWEQKNTRLERTIKKEKLKRIKIFATLFIFLTLLFTLYQIYSSNEDAIVADREKKQQHTIDSLKSYNDSISHLNQLKHLDTIRIRQLAQLAVEFASNNSIEAVKEKSEAIVRDLLHANARINETSKKIDKASINASRSFKELTKSSQRLLYMLDDDKITMRFALNFWNPNTNSKISEYLKQTGIEKTYVDIDENFPFYDSLQAFLKESSLKVAFYPQTKAQMGTKDKHVIDNVQTPALIYLENKSSLTFFPYQKATGSNQNLIYYHVYPPGGFKMSYYTPAKCFFFTCETVDLKVEKRNDENVSILDLDSTAVFITFKLPTVRDNPKCFFNLDSSNVTFQFNFSNKKSSQYYQYIYPLNLWGHDVWPEYYQNPIMLKK